MMKFRRNEIIEVIYLDSEGKLTQRHIRVIAQRENKLLAYCFSKKKIRSFHTANILATKKVGAAS